MTRLSQVKVENCPFCEIARNGSYEHQYDTLGVMRIEPLNPVVIGHKLFVSKWHEAWPYCGSEELLSAVHLYIQDQKGDFNLIMSCGTDATQTVEHVHLHFVPRRPNDGLQLPWSKHD